MTVTSIPDLKNKTIQGEFIPSIGLGTYELTGDTCKDAVACALEAGYRHLDTARMYGNEKAVGEGIRQSGVDRESIFLTSKVWLEHLRPHQIREEIENSLRDLQTEYLDLALIHWPNPQVPLEESLAALNLLQVYGKIRHYGVSNFTPRLLEQATKQGAIFCNQVEYHPFLNQDRLLELARRKHIMLTAYCPLAQGDAVQSPELRDVGDKYGKSEAQVALRWLLEQDQVFAIPRSSKPEHIRSNLEVFDFALDESDLELLASLPKDQRKINPDFAPDWDEG